MRHSIGRQLFLITALALLFAALAFSQTFTAAIRGVVTDPSGAAVPGAKVTVTDVERGLDYTTETDEQGRYAVVNLQPSTYMLTVEAPGFQTYQRNPFELVVQQQATIDVQLQVGEVTTVVEVEAEQPLLNTTIANLGQVIENTYILQLPLIARNPMALTYLTPGVVRAGGRMGGQNNTNFVANGARNSTSDVILDGVTVTNPEQNSGITQLKFSPSVDAVQEFKVQTNFFSAEFGQTGGAIINMVTRSGTNEFHGTGYWFYRADEFNANSFFANRAGSPKPDWRRHQFGGVLGGPIRKDKAFFFVSYQRTDAKNPFARTATVPTPQQKEGDFSDYMTPSGELIQIFNPLDTIPDPDNPNDILRLPFPNNVVPKSLWDPVSANAVKYFPDPNQEGAPFTRRDNWFKQESSSSISNQIVSKVDVNLSEKARFSARYGVDWMNSNPPNLYGNPAYPFNDGPMKNKVHTGMIDYTRTQSPTTIIQVRYGITRVDFNRDPMETFNPTDLGLPSVIAENADFLTFPAFTPEGYTAIGTRGWLIIGSGEDVNQITGSVTKIAGGHNIKFGGEFRHSRLDYLQPGYPSGFHRFERQSTRQRRFGFSATEGNALASMLVGWYAGWAGAMHHDPWSYSRSQYYGMYIQDDWKITRKLTLNLGLRYDFDIPRWEKEYRYSYWDFDTPASINDQVPMYDLRGVYRFTDEKTKSDFDGDYNNVQPRLGFAYALNDRTSIRGGFGFFYALSRATVKGHLGSGFTSSSNITASFDGNRTRYATPSNPYPDGLNLPPGRSLGIDTFLGLSAGTTNRTNNNPLYMSWNFSIQRQVPGNAIIEVNYTGSRGVHLLFAGDTNLRRLDPMYWSIGRTELTRRVPNPFYGVITDPKSALSRETIVLNHLLRPMQHFTGASQSETQRGNSVYHALQIKYEKRFSHGLTMLAHYTWAKMIDDISHGSGNLSWLGGSTSVQDWSNLRNERSLSAHDVAHRFVMSWAYQLPIGAGRAVGTDWGRLTNALLGGWEISGIVTLQTGVPINVTQSGGVLWDATQRPNLIGNPDPGGSVREKFDSGQWFNVSAFEKPEPDTIGTAPRTLNYRTPPLSNLDFALFKNFQITESMRAQFRAEFDNATNTPTFGPPNSTFGSTAFGRINNYASGRGPRNIQLGVKFYF